MAAYGPGNEWRLATQTRSFTSIKINVWSPQDLPAAADPEPVVHDRQIDRPLSVRTVVPLLGLSEATAHDR